MPKFDKTLRYYFALLRGVPAFCAFAVLMAAAQQPAFAQQQNSRDMPAPSRIGMVSGSASFWRPGAENWSPAQVNTPLAAGDALYTAAGATLEVQIGSRAYVRMAQNSMLTLLGNEPNLEQFKMSSGIAAFDLRNLRAGRSIELDTPSGAFNIDSAGYYRVEVTDSATHFIVRRGGEAMVTLADGSSRLIAPSQEAVAEIGGQGNVETYVAPDNDAWDEWNYARTDNLIDAISNRYVSPEVYGAGDLDHYGNWRTTPDYGPVWVPSGMAPGWVPYSTGSWVWDPVYAWTWVDMAPWGWAPYHYGRWVYINDYWAWAPGPRLFYPAYAPALVAFFSTGGGAAVQIGFGGPAVSWVALGWGEPCLPWWGHPDFVGRPWWGGWAGPRVINNVVVEHNTVINNITNITYQNINQRNALVAIPERNFGHGRVAGAMHLDPVQVKELTPIAGRHPVQPGATSLAPTVAKTVGPAQAILNRPAVVLHTPLPRALPWRLEKRETPEPRPVTSENKVITVRPQTGQSVPWASFGKTAGPVRNEPRHPPEPPRIESWSAHAVPPLREERQMPKPMLQERMRPATPQRQQEPVRIMTAPQMIQRESLPPPPSRQAQPSPPQRQSEPTRIMNVPQTIQRESPPRLTPREAFPAERHEQSPRNLKAEQPSPLPGQPANQQYPRRVQREEQSR